MFTTLPGVSECGWLIAQGAAHAHRGRSGRLKPAIARSARKRGRRIDGFSDELGCVLDQQRAPLAQQRRAV
jgi:hypothetical protein